MPAEREERPRSAGRSRRRQVFGADRPWDLIDAVEEAYGKLDLREVRKLDPDFKPIGAARRLFRVGGGFSPDKAAQSMFNDGIYKGDPGQVAEFAAALNEAAAARKGNREMSAKHAKEQVELGKQRSQFETRVLEGKRPKADAGRVEVVPVSELFPGDTFEVQGHKFTVKDLEWDPDTDQLVSVTLKDGPKFGVQRIEGQEAEFIHVDRDSLMRKEGLTDFLSPEDAAALESEPRAAASGRIENEEGTPGTPADKFTATWGPRLSKQQLERIEGQELSRQWTGPDGTEYSLTTNGNKIWIRTFVTERNVRGGSIGTQAASYLVMRPDGRTIIDGSFPARQDKAARQAHEAMEQFVSETMANQRAIDVTSTVDKVRSVGSSDSERPPEAFSLESVTEDQLKAEAIAQQEAAAAAAIREEIARRLAAPLTGDSSDVGQGALFDEGADLFSGPSAQSRGRTQGAEATTAQAYPGGPLGDGPVPAADNPGFSQFPMELPEAVRFARDLAGGVYPKLRDRLRVLGGQALGVFRHNDAAGKASIEMRRDLFDLPKAQRERLRAEAEAYAKATGKDDAEIAQIARDRFEFLKREAFKENPLLALKVLWHEIGHWVDWLPDHMIQGRGNLLGRLASLKDYLRHTLPEGPGVPDQPLKPGEKEKLRRQAEKELQEEIESGAIREIVRTILVEDPAARASGVTPEQVKELFGMNARETMPELYRWFAEQPADVKKEIVRAAMKGQVDARVPAPGPTMREETVRTKTLGPVRKPTKAEIQERFRKLFREELARRRMVELQQLKSEIEPMIAWWRGTPRMEEYFKKSSEMYAEAFSIFANNPAALAKRAPTYYRVLTNYLARKPEVAKLYREIQDSIASGTIMRDRVADLRRSWRVDDEQSMERARNRERLTFRDFVDNVQYHFDDRLGPVYRVAKKAAKAGDQETAGAVRGAAGNYRYRAAEHERFLTRVNREVVEALADAGVDRVMLAEYMFHKHVTESRFVKDRDSGELRMIGNPMGWAPKNSLERLAEMRSQLGPDGFARLEVAQKRFRQIYEEQVVDLLKRSGMASPELMQAIEERTFYATFQKAQGEVPRDGIEQFMLQRFGPEVGARIYRQVGNLGEIKNPLTATTMKALSLTSAAYKNIAKRETVKAMLQHDANNIREADVRWTGKRMEPVIKEDKRWGTIVFLEGGVPQAYYVPKYVADGLSAKSPIENLTLLALLKPVGWMKSLLTQLNYGFWPVAFARDVVGWGMQMPGAGPVDYVKHAAPALKAAYDAWGGRKPSPLADEALRRQMLISRADNRGVLSAADEFDLAIASYGLDPVKWGEADRQGTRLMRLWNAYREFGQVLERTQKIAGMTYLDEQFPLMPEWQKQEIVRERAGSPDFLRRGSAGPVIDLGMMFFNPWKEGIRSVGKAFAENKFSFSSKALAVVVAPAVLQSMAVRGALGEEIEEMYGSVSDYDLTNYLVIPLGWADRERKKVAYLRLPLWEPARVMHGALFQGFTGRGNGILAQAGGQIPGLNPLLTTAVMWGTYAMGKNPYDSFRGHEILSPDVFAVGGAPAMQALLRQTFNNLGGSLITRLQERPLGEPEPERLEAFMQLPVVSNALGRWIKVSNRGVFDRDRKAAEPVAKEAAERREVVRGVVEKLMSNPPQALTASERVILRHPDAQRYFYELRRKAAKSRSSFQQQRLQRLPSKAQKAAAMGQP